MDIPINQILVTAWDVRSTPEDENGIVALSNSLRKDGFIHPITCVKEGSKFKVIAGRRRLKAAKMIGLKTVPVYIKDDLNAETDLRRITVIENCHRKDILDSERAKGFLAIYESAGYKRADVIKGVKSIDNWFSQDKNRTFDRLITEQSSVIRPKHQAYELVYDPKFVEICKDVGFSPKYQYQLISIIHYIDPKVVKEMEKKELPTNKKILLTTRPLPQHPVIQKELIDEIKEIPIEKARVRVHQVAKDLETGYLEKASENTYVVNNTKERENVKKDGKVLEPLNVRIMDITSAINSFLFKMTDRSITHGEHEYTQDIIKHTRDYRLSIVKTLSERSMVSLETDLKLVKLVTNEVLGMLEDEFDAREAKKEMISK